MALGLPWWLSGKVPMQEMWVRSLGWEDPLEKEITTHSCSLVWGIAWTEEPGSPWGCKESDTTGQLTYSLSVFKHK